MAAGLTYGQREHSIRIDPTSKKHYKKSSFVTLWAEQKKLCHGYDTSMKIIVIKTRIIIDVVGSYFYEKKS